MCNCATELASSLSKEYVKYGRNATVSLNFVIEAYIRPFVIAKKQYLKNGKELRVSKRGTTEHIRFTYCPICGQKLPENYKAYITVSSS
jgi:hypothetical protein